MRITIVQGAFLPVPPLRGGAVEKIWFALGQEFARRGHEVTHLSRRFPGLAEEETIQGVRHLRASGFEAPSSMLSLKLRDLAYSVAIRRRLPPAEILVTNTFWLPMLVRSGSRFGQLYVHVARYPKGQMRFYGHAARLQTVSKPIEKAIISEAPHLAAKVRSIPNPLTGPLWTGDPAADSRDRTILYVGRIHPEKGLDLLLEAFAAMQRENPSPWKLVLVGPSEFNAGGGGPEYLAHLKALATPCASQVEWVGPVYDPVQLNEAYYRRASLFVYPSLAERGETFGVSALEAMAQGCPPLVSELACFRDFLSDQDTGFFFNHRDPDPAKTLAAKLRALIENPALLRQTGARALLQAQKFRLESVAEAYLQDFQTLTNR